MSRLLIEGGTHNNSMRVGSSEYRDALSALFEFPPKAASAAPAEPHVARAPLRRRAATPASG